MNTTTEPLAETEVPAQQVAAPPKPAARNYVALVLTVGIAVLSGVGMLLPLIPEAIGVLSMIMMLALIFLRVPVAVAMIIPSLMGLYALRGWRTIESALGSVPYSQMANWGLSVIPMFVLMGLVLWRAGLTESLYRAARHWLGWAPGGLAVGTNLAGAGLASVSGSTVGTTYALARIGIPEMLKAGYDKRLAIGSVIVAGLPGQLIPPSIMMVIYAGIAGVPVGPQLMAGIGPGVLVAILFTVMLMVYARRWAPPAPMLAPDKESDVGWRLRFQSLVEIWPMPLIVGVVVWGMFSGTFTATEAGAAAALASTAALLLLRRKDGPLRALANAAMSTVTSVGAIFFLLVGVAMLSRMFTLTGITSGFAEWVESMDLNRVSFLLLMTFVYLILGTFLESLPMLVLTIPIILPSLELLDISPLWFGVFAVFMGELAVLSPPVGILAYIIYGIIRDPEVNQGQKVSLGDVFVSVMWMMPMAVIVILILIFFPELATYIPSHMNG